MAASTYLLSPEYEATVFLFLLDLPQRYVKAVLNISDAWTAESAPRNNFASQEDGKTSVRNFLTGWWRDKQASLQEVFTDPGKHKNTAD